MEQIKEEASALSKEKASLQVRIKIIKVIQLNAFAKSIIFFSSNAKISNKFNAMLKMNTYHFSKYVVNSYPTVILTECYLVPGNSLSNNP